MEDFGIVLRRDPTLKRIMNVTGPPAIGTREPFTALVRAIVSQQVSVAAAQSILGRLITRVPLDPERLSRARLSTLHGCGLSRSKAQYIRNVANFARDGGLRNLDRLTDVELLDHLTDIKGVGEWTAQMVMMFAVGRPDIWPVGDVGIQRAAKQLYRIRSESGLKKLGRRFQPYRSYAAWYLWRSLDATP